MIRTINPIGLPTKFINKTIFKKVSDSTGGCLKIIVSGGAPIAAETQEFLSMTICPVYQGYGLTEVCGILFAQPLSEIGSYGNVGVPSSCTEIKLVSEFDSGF
jgi:long-chain acyl-CoA synthetase